MDIHKARWVQNSPTTLILKMPSRDGGAVLAHITKYHHFLFVWRLDSNDTGGHAQTRYAAMRRARKALREDPNV